MEEIFNTVLNPSEPTIIEGETYISYENAKEIFENLGDTETEYYVLVIDGDMMFPVDHSNKILYGKNDNNRVNWYPLHTIKKLDKKIVELEQGISDYKSNNNGVYSVEDKANNVCYTQKSHQFWGIDAPRILEKLKNIKENL